MKKYKTSRKAKASFNKWKRENPEAYRKVYGPWTSLEATINILNYVIPKHKFKSNGSDVLGRLPFSPIDAMEFVCGFSAECGYEFSQPLCDTIAAFMKQGSKKTVKDLSKVIERAFIEDEPKERMTFCDDGNDCRHFECHDAYAEDKQLCEDEGCIFTEKQQCYMCKHWDNSHGGQPCDCTMGKCTYKWKDPNGDKQLTFWKEPA